MTEHCPLEVNNLRWVGAPDADGIPGVPMKCRQTCAWLWEACVRDIESEAASIKKVGKTPRRLVGVVKVVEGSGVEFLPEEYEFDCPDDPLLS